MRLRRFLSIPVWAVRMTCDLLLDELLTDEPEQDRAFDILEDEEYGELLVDTTDEEND